MLTKIAAAVQRAWDHRTSSRHRLVSGSCTAALTVLLGFFASAGPAHAAEAVDQNVPGVDGAFASVGIDRLSVQTFTAQLSGHLTRLDLRLSQDGAVTSLTVSIWATSGGAPTSQLATQSLSAADVAAIGSSFQTVTIRFDNPALITAGTKYAIVATSSGTCGFLFGPCIKWSQAGSPYTGGEQGHSEDGGATWTMYTGSSNDAGFTTYVDDAWSQATSSSRTASPVPVRTLLFQDSAQCVTAGGSTPDSAWLQLPSAADCPRPGYTLLGWSTSREFPTATAKAQMDRGWGAIDDVFDGVRMVFIPAGGFTRVSGDNNLFPVWIASS